jgi:hypothetical protein
MVAFSDDLSVSNNYAANHRIWTYVIKTYFRQLKAAAHVKFINHRGKNSYIVRFSYFYPQ